MESQNQEDFWLNIAENRVYLWYRYCLKLFGKLKREANFANPVFEMLIKKGWERREKLCDSGVRKELNFGNEIIEIPSTRIRLPRLMKCSKEKCLKGKNQSWQSSCRNSRGVTREKKGLWQPSCRKWEEKKNGDNQVAENEREKKLCQHNQIIINKYKITRSCR